MICFLSLFDLFICLCSVCILMAQMFALLCAEHNVEEREGIMKVKERLEGEGEEWANGI